MTAADVITLVRETMNDNHYQSGYRHQDAELLRALDEAHRELLADRPNLQLAVDGTLSAITAITATTDALLVDENHRQALANKVCHKLYLKDDEDDANARLAEQKLGLYAREI